MKFVIAIVLTILLAFTAGLYLPWWSVAIAGFIVAALIRQSPIKSFLSGFLGLFIFWGVLSLWIDNKNGGLLSQKIATIIPLGGSTMLLIFAGALIGSIVAGMGALTASYLRK